MFGHKKGQGGLLARLGGAAAPMGPRQLNLVSVEGFSGNGMATIGLDNSFSVIAHMPPPHTVSAYPAVYAAYLVDATGRNGFFAGTLKPAGNGMYQASFRSPVPLVHYDKVVISLESPQNIMQSPQGPIVMKVKEGLFGAGFEPVKRIGGNVWGKVKGFVGSRFGGKEMEADDQPPVQPSGQQPYQQPYQPSYQTPYQAPYQTQQHAPYQTQQQAPRQQVAYQRPPYPQTGYQPSAQPHAAYQPSAQPQAAYQLSAQPQANYQPSAYYQGGYHWGHWRQSAAQPGAYQQRSFQTGHFQQNRRPLTPQGQSYSPPGNYQGAYQQQGPQEQAAQQLSPQQFSQQVTQQVSQQQPVSGASGSGINTETVKAEHPTAENTSNPAAFAGSPPSQSVQVSSAEEQPEIIESLKE